MNPAEFSNTLFISVEVVKEIQSCSKSNILRAFRPSIQIIKVKVRMEVVSGKGLSSSRSYQVWC